MARLPLLRGRGLQEAVSGAKPNRWHSPCCWLPFLILLKNHGSWRIWSWLKAGAARGDYGEPKLINPERGMKRAVKSRMQVGELQAPSFRPSPPGERVVGGMQA